MHRQLLTAITIASLGATATMGAQCPDGSPPPCRALRTPDSNRIAVFPFRITSGDTLLGEGFAELLATEFTGEGSPRAVEMAAALRAWRAAGGGLRTPIARARTLRLARELGAGLTTEGSIVQLGRQIAITATLWNTRDGQQRAPPVRVTASVDSLDPAVQRVGSMLLASIGGQQRAVQGGVRFTDSPGAMRAYLQGLAAFRRGRVGAASDAFERAVTLDSTFAQAIFRRYLMIEWGGTSPALEASARRLERTAWEHRTRLAPQERIILEAFLGPRYPERRTAQAHFSDRQRAVDLLPDSPDALYFLGDFWYHFGGRIDAPSQLTRAREMFGRAVAIDSQATLLRHLVEVGLRLRDTSLLKGVVPALLRTDSVGRWAAAWLGAASIGDARQLGSLRLHAEASAWPLESARVAYIPAALLDEMNERSLAAAPNQQRRSQLQALYAFVLVDRGRPAAAAQMLRSLPDTIVDLDRMLVERAVTDAAYGLDVSASVDRLGLAYVRDSASATLRSCTLALWRRRNGDSAITAFDEYHEGAADLRLSPTYFCAWTIALLGLPKRDGLVVFADLARADSTLRNTISYFFQGYTTYYLARAWEASGHPKRALAALRYRGLGVSYAEPIWSYREEGRLAALVGDTASAIRAYNYYLEIMRDAEAVLQPKRDSVRAELARLIRRN